MEEPLGLPDISGASRSRSWDHRGLQRGSRHDDNIPPRCRGRRLFPPFPWATMIACALWVYSPRLPTLTPNSFGLQCPSTSRESSKGVLSRPICLPARDQPSRWAARSVPSTASRRSECSGHTDQRSRTRGVGRARRRLPLEVETTPNPQSLVLPVDRSLRRGAASRPTRFLLTIPRTPFSRNHGRDRPDQL